MDYVLGLNFVSFWGFFKKMPELMKFLDEFIKSVRKYNDIYKVQFIFD
jgi:hypothetical protein